MPQVNIHVLLAEETYDQCFDVLNDRLTDFRLANLNAVTFLWLKPKGKRNKLTQIKSLSKLSKLTNYALDNGIIFGLDSCSAKNFLKSIKQRPEYDRLKDYVEPCESTLFSYYINVEGKGFPCSFAEEAYDGIDFAQIDDFIEEVWEDVDTVEFREKLENLHKVNGIRSCPIFNLEVESQEEFQSELTNISKDIKEEDIVKLSITAPKETVDKVGSVILPGGLEGRVSLQVQFFLKEDKPEILIDDSLNPIDMLYQYIDLNKEQFKNIDTKKIKLLGKKYLQSCEGVEGA